MSQQGLRTHSEVEHHVEISRPLGQESPQAPSESMDQLLTKHGVELSSLLKNTPWYRGTLH